MTNKHIELPALSDDRIVDLVSKHVGGPTPSYPLDTSDWINFARAVIYADRALLADRERQAGEAVAMSREELIDLIADHLNGTYHCHRVWSAWNIGTMSQDDFEDVGESDTPAELADAILASLPAPQAVQADTIQEEMSDVADEHAHGVALALECVLADYSGKWWDMGIRTLSGYRSAMNSIHEKMSPTFMGEPVLASALASKPPQVEQKPVAHVGLSTFAWGVTRMGDNPKAVMVSFRSEPTDDDLRTLHEALRPANGRTVHANAQPEQVAQDKIDAERWRTASQSRNHGIVVFNEFGQGWVYDQKAIDVVDATRAARARGDGERS